MLKSPLTTTTCSSLTAKPEVASSSRSSLLMTNVEFAPSENEHSLTSQSLQSKYHQLGRGTKAAKVSVVENQGGKQQGTNSPSQSRGSSAAKVLAALNGNHDGKSKYHLGGDGVPVPRVQLYPPGHIKLDWQEVHKIGAGLANLGNTCFMNAVIQCLTYCAPLTNYLLHSDHNTSCKMVGFCMMCELQKHIKRALDKPGEVIKPLYIYQKLKSIAKHFQFGRQEDAHEFLRYVIEKLWRSSLTNHLEDKTLDPASKETTVVNQIFGGYHRSQVICLRCKERSNTYDHFMDFILDIKQNVSSLEKALDRFIQPELLQNENAYKCPKCNMKVPAQKRFTVHRAPNVATFQLKRFDYGRFPGGKITKHVAYPEKFDLRPFMSDPKGSTVVYRLNAVLVHLGASCNSGHYICYVRNSNSCWYLMDDARVNQVSIHEVLNQQAYLLFYVRVPPPKAAALKKTTTCAVLNQENVHAVKNGPCGQATKPAGSPVVPVSRPPTKSPSAPAMISVASSAKPHSSIGCLSNGTTSEKKLSSILPLPQFREKIAFGIRKPTLEDVVEKTQSSTSWKERLGMASLTSKHVTAKSAKKSCLVPYVGDSSELSEDENTPQKGSSVSVKKEDNLCKKHLGSVAFGESKSLDVESPRQRLDATEVVRRALSEESSRSPTMHRLTVKPTVTENIQPSRISPNDSEPSSGSSVSSPALPLKLKTTCSSTWLVSEGIPHSPSIASGSSTNSVCSTTDWTVLDHQEGSGRVNKSRKFLGWTVSEKDGSADHSTLPSTSSSNSSINQPTSVDFKDRTLKREASFENDPGDEDGPVAGRTHVRSENGSGGDRKTPLTACKRRAIFKMSSNDSTVSCDSSRSILTDDRTSNSQDEKSQYSQGEDESSIACRGSGQESRPQSDDKAKGKSEKYCKSLSEPSKLHEFREERSQHKEKTFLRNHKKHKHRERPRDQEAEPSGLTDGVGTTDRLSHNPEGNSKKRGELRLHDNDEDNAHSVGKKQKTEDQGLNQPIGGPHHRHREGREQETREGKPQMTENGFPEQPCRLNNLQSSSGQQEAKGAQTLSHVVPVLNCNGSLSDEKSVRPKILLIEPVNGWVSHLNCSGESTHFRRTLEKAYPSILNSGEKLSSVEDNINCQRRLQNHLHTHDSDSGKVVCSDSGDSSDASSYEMEWVERTKETVEEERRRHSSQVPSKLWDDDQASNKQTNKHRHMEAGRKSNFHWDGSHKTSAVTELLRFSGHGYGSSVSSWEGKKNFLDQVIQCEQNGRQSPGGSSYDEDFDQGKVKKRKRPKYPNAVHTQFHHSNNPFQKFNDTKYQKRWHPWAQSDKQYKHHKTNFHKNHHSYNHYHRYNHHYSHKIRY